MLGLGEGDFLTTEACESNARELAVACEIFSGEQVRRGGWDLPLHRPTLRLPASLSENLPAPVPGRNEESLNAGLPYCLLITLFRKRHLKPPLLGGRELAPGLCLGAAAVLNHMEVSQQILAADLRVQRLERSSRVDEP